MACKEGTANYTECNHQREDNTWIQFAGFHGGLVRETGHVTVRKSSRAGAGPGTVGRSLAGIHDAFDSVWLRFAHITVCGVICPSSSGKAFHISMQNLMNPLINN